MLQILLEGKLFPFYIAIDVDALTSEKGVLFQEQWQTAKGVVRKYWKELHDRLDPELVIDELFQNGVLHFDDLEDIRSERARHKKADAFLRKIMTNSPENIRSFIEVLTQTEGIKDLGLRMLTDLNKEMPRDAFH